MNCKQPSHLLRWDYRFIFLLCLLTVQFTLTILQDSRFIPKFIDRVVKLVESGRYTWAKAQVKINNSSVLFQRIWKQKRPRLQVLNKSFAAWHSLTPLLMVLNKCNFEYLGQILSKISQNYYFLEFCQQTLYISLNK